MEHSALLSPCDPAPADHWLWTNETSFSLWQPIFLVYTFVLTLEYSLVETWNMNIVKEKKAEDKWVILEINFLDSWRLSFLSSLTIKVLTLIDGLLIELCHTLSYFITHERYSLVLALLACGGVESYLLLTAVVLGLLTFFLKIFILSQCVLSYDFFLLSVYISSFSLLFLID